MFLYISLNLNYFTSSRKTEALKTDYIVITYLNLMSSLRLRRSLRVSVLYATKNPKCNFPAAINQKAQRGASLIK